VRPERIEPGKPQQNGRHERLHRTVKQDTANPPAADLRAQQRRFDRFRRMFNEERPHEALGQQTPASHYRPAQRVYCGRLVEPDYPADYQVRRVRTNGEIKWRGGHVFVSEELVGEPVGIAESDDGGHQVYYATIFLGCRERAGSFTKGGPRPSETFPSPRINLLPMFPIAQPRALWCAWWRRAPPPRPPCA
jgi:hypothetical protein